MRKKVYWELDTHMNTPCCQKYTDKDANFLHFSDIVWEN